MAVMNLFVKFDAISDDNLWYQKNHFIDKMFEIKGVKGVNFHDTMGTLCGCKLDIKPFYRRRVRKELNNMRWFTYIEVRNYYEIKEIV